MRIMALLGCCLLMLFSSVPVAAQETPMTRQDVEEIIAETLEQNPELVINAIQEFQRRRQMAEMLPKIDIYRDFLESGENHPVLGNPEGRITIVEFFDYRCGFCKRNFPAVMHVITNNPDVRFIPRQYPVLDRAGQTPLSRRAATAALAAHRQGKFEAFHSAMMQLEGSLTEEKIYDIARRAGLDVDQLKKDMGDKLIGKSVTNNLAIGQEIGFSGTPSYIIENNIEIGAVGADRLQKAVDRARKELGG